VGPGQDCLAPKWVTGNNGHPSRSDSCPSISVEQNGLAPTHVNPSPYFLFLALFFTALHRSTSSNGRPSERRRTTAPPWPLSPVRMPTNGWTRRRRMAPRWGTTRAHPQGSRSGGCTQLYVGWGFSSFVPIL
jgi:hypothetical protein